MKKEGGAIGVRRRGAEGIRKEGARPCTAHGTVTSINEIYPLGSPW